MSSIESSVYIWQCVMLCFFSGFLLAILYTGFQMLRVIFQIRWIGTALLDILFFAVSAIVVFLVALAMNNGYLRFFQLAVTLIGFCVFMLVLYPVLMNLTTKINKTVMGLSKKITMKYLALHSKKKTNRQKKVKKIKNPAKIPKKTKKDLKNLCRLVYNTNNKSTVLEDTLHARGKR